MNSWEDWEIDLILVREIGLKILAWVITIWVGIYSARLFPPTIVAIIFTLFFLLIESYEDYSFGKMMMRDIACAEKGGGNK